MCPDGEVVIEMRHENIRTDSQGLPVGQRRARRCAACGQPLQGGPFRIDPVKGIAQFADMVVRLTPLERRALAALNRSYPKGVSTDQMVAHLYGDRADGGPINDRLMVRGRIWALRRKLRDAAIPAAIATRYGTGYWLEVSA